MKRLYLIACFAASQMCCGMELPQEQVNLDETLSHDLALPRGGSKATIVKAVRSFCKKVWSMNKAVAGDVVLYMRESPKKTFFVISILGAKAVVAWYCGNMCYLHWVGGRYEPSGQLAFCYEILPAYTELDQECYTWDFERKQEEDFVAV